jgi:hypothetical protein
VTKRPATDRRHGRRYEIVGDLLGTFELQPPRARAAAVPARTRVPVHIVDIGAGGVLMACPRGPAPGDTGTLRVELTSGWFVTEVEVLHHRGGQAPGMASRAGGAFRELSEDGRRTLEQFLRTAKT